MSTSPARPSLRVLLCLGMLLLLPVSSLWAQDKETEKIQEATSVFSEMMSIEENQIPPELLKEARGVAIVPGVVKAGFLFGGRHGTGVMLVQRDDGTWSAPAFLKLTGGSFGLQAGVSSTDVVLVFRNENSVQSLLNGKVTLGGNIGVAAGPVGRNAEAATDARLKAEIYSYSRSRGAFAGIALEGASLRFDGDRNAALYGNSTPLKSILFGDTPSPSSANRLRTLLRKHVE